MWENKIKTSKCRLKRGKCIRKINLEYLFEQGCLSILKYNYKKKSFHILGIKKNKLKDIANGENGTEPEELFLCLTKIGSRINFPL